VGVGPPVLALSVTRTKERARLQPGGVVGHVELAGRFQGYFEPAGLAQVELLVGLERVA
jgi:hypothetical protein